MGWTIEIDEHAARDLKKLGTPVARRIRDFLRDRLAGSGDPRSLGKPLQGATLGKLWRYRVGDYRIVCQIRNEALVVLALAVGHRREVYRR